MKKILLVFLMTAVVFLTSCSPKYTEDTFFCMDTAVTVRTNGYEGAQRAVRELLMGLDTMFSRYAENSCVKKYNDSESGAELTEELKELILYFFKKMGNEI